MQIQVLKRVQVYMCSHTLVLARWGGGSEHGLRSAIHQAEAQERP